MESESLLVEFLRTCEEYRGRGEIRGWGVTKSERGWRLAIISMLGVCYQEEGESLDAVVSRLGQKMMKLSDERELLAALQLEDRKESN